MPNEIATGYVARRQFVPLHMRRERWGVAVCHVRAGKTVACINDLVDAAIRCDKPNPRFAYVAPFFSQAKDVAWAYLKQYTSAIPGVEVNESELRVDLPGGKRVRLYGADNYQRLSGIYLDGVVMDEYGDMDPRAWKEVIRARLSDRQGWAIFIGTPKGVNHFADLWESAQNDPEWFTLRLKASETGILPPHELASARQAMSDEDYAAQYECSFEASIVGSYWGREMQRAEIDGRISRVSYQPEIAVETWWDLGVDDATAIWFTQTIGREVHLIDYYENSGEGLPHYAKILQERGYVYGAHHAPHDIQVRELGSGRSRLETAAGLGIRFQIVPNIDRPDGIDAARSFISRCWFDREKTERGRLALVSYHKTWDEKRRVFSSAPYHDWCFAGDTLVLTRYGTYPINRLPYQGEVLTPCGWKYFQNPRVTRKNAPLVEVRFKDGLMVRCTPDHSFLTASGWKYASDLMPGSEIRSSLTFSRGISMAVSTALGRANGIRREVVDFFTETYGRLRLALSRAAATFTTETAISIIPTSGILSASRQMSTYRLAGATTSDTSKNTSLTPRGNGRRIGISPRPADYGTADTRCGQKAGRNGGGNSSRALSAAENLWRWFGRMVISRNSAPIFARPRIIESVSRLDLTEDVWCITVPGEECFSLSNGAVVHNCSNAADAFRYLAVGHKNAPMPKQRQQSRPYTISAGDSGTGWMAH